MNARMTVLRPALRRALRPAQVSRRAFVAGVIASLGAALLPARAVAGEALVVVATHPALASIVEQVGGPRVTVSSITLPTGDVHAVDARPSVFARLRDADAFVHSGLDLELWAVDAVKGSRNPKIQAGKPGDIDASAGIKLLDVPEAASRADGDVHLYGNPHYWMDPLNGKQIASTVAAALTAIDPDGAAAYLENRKRFEADINERLLKWLRKAIAFKNAPLVVYHDSLPYFTRRFGFQAAAFVEPKPRIPPTQAHLLSVLETMKARGVKVIVREPFHDRSATEFLAERSGAKVVTLSTMPGGIEGTATYQDLIERDLETVLEALR